LVYRVIGGHNRGRVLKTVKAGSAYNRIAYGPDGRPVSITIVNEFGKCDTKYFFDFEGYSWAMELHESDNPYYHGKHRYGDVFKFQCDSKGRIAYYASIAPGHSSRVEKYEYMDDGLIVCHMFYYVLGRSGSNKSIPAGFKGSPMDEYKYEISFPEQDIKEYVKKGDDFVFIREIKKSKEKMKGAPKPVAGSYEIFEAWLDGRMTDKNVPTKGGLLFLLFGPNEDGFGVSFEVCRTFDSEDDEWACDSFYSSDMHMIRTTGLCENSQALDYVVSMIKKYKRSGKERGALKAYMGIGVFFSDGDIIYL